MEKLIELLAQYLDMEAKSEDSLRRLWEKIGPEEGQEQDSHDYELGFKHGTTYGLQHAAMLIRKYLLDEEGTD